MNWLKSLAGLFSGSGSGGRAYWLHVVCDHCGEKLRTRVDLYNDLSVDYGESGSEITYFCRKTLVGSSGCYRPIEVALTFDEKKTMKSHKVSGGRFLTQEQYDSE